MKYIVKKTGTLIITLLIVSFLSFLAFQLIPGNAAISKLGTEATPDKIAALEEEMGLNQPVLLRYVHWLGNFITGDMGTSYSYHMPVTQMIGDKIPITLFLTLLSFFFILVISIPLGIFTAKHVGGKLDQVLMISNQILMSVPGFFLGILITFVFGLLLHWFTPGGYIAITENFWGFAGYLIAPCLAIALPKCAMGVKVLRGSMMKELHMDYVRTAYSRGNGENRVLSHHVLRNALLPVLTFWAMTIADIVAGSIIIEQVFTIPGLGSMLITSISNRDYPVVQGIIVLLAGMVVLINYIVDILYMKIDPRIQSNEL